MRRPLNIAGAAARWSARHPGTARIGTVTGDGGRILAPGG